MSEPSGMPETTVPSESSGRFRASRGRRVALVVTVLACFLGLAATGAIVDRKHDTTPDHPSTWDERVVPYVEITERLRGLEFKHPVHVDFLAPKEFDKQVTSEDSDLTDEDREEMTDIKDLLRSLDLVPADLDLLKAANTMGSSGVIGLYSFDDDRVRINGTEITPAVKSTLVHELTHVLQDQHFGIGDHMDSFDDDTTGASSAYGALVEGDASRIETKYAKSLSRADRKALRKEQNSGADEADKGMAEVPSVLQTLMGAPYALGEALLDAAVVDADDEANEANEAVDDLFANPPTTDEHLLDPWSLLSGEEEPDQVKKPGLAPDQKSFDSGTFGALTWYLVLAARIPEVAALDAADGWGGDAYAAYRAGGESCVRIDFVGDNPSDNDEMARALRRWSAKGPAGAASVKADATMVHFHSCAAKAGKPVGSTPDDVLSLPLTRTYITIGALESGAPPLSARCAASHFIHRVPIGRLQGDFGKQPGDEAIRREIWQAC
jgi:hypothetical protein